MTRFRSFLAAVLACCLVSLAVSSARAEGKVKVFVLAGQSNMEGKAPNKLFEHQATDPKTKEFFAHLRDGDQWVERDDVFIKYLNRHGKLTLGYGSRDRTGSEYEFGYVLGEHYDEPVLLIKACWGGHSLYKLFRSPSNPVSQERLDKELAQAIERTKKQNERIAKEDAEKPENKRRKPKPLPTMAEIKSGYGESYRNMMDEVAEVKANYETLFPELKGKELEFAGLFWFQGWNDQYNDAWLEYEDNFEAFIKDVRKDLGEPNLPVVTAMMGQHGSAGVTEGSPREAINAAQKAMEKTFPGTVTAVATDVLVDEAAEELYPRWRDNFEQWQKTGGDRAYHYLGSAIWFTRIGNACAKAMIELDAEK